jgi:ribonuclease P protein component
MPGADPHGTGPAPGAQPTILRKRAEFLAAARARRQATAGFLLQARRREPDEGASGVRVGFTCSKKVGNAVIRNRAKRRLRDLARAVLPAMGHPGWDYVLVGRPGATVSRDYADLLADLTQAMTAIHAPRKPRDQPTVSASVQDGATP